VFLAEDNKHEKKDEGFVLGDRFAFGLVSQAERAKIEEDLS
jgi:hypothetical protein